MSNLPDFPLSQMKEAEDISKGSFEIMLNHWVDMDKAQLSIRVKELKLTESIENNAYKLKRFSIFAGLFLGGIASGVGAYGVHVKADPVLLGTALAFISGIACVFLWGYQRKD